jgi:alginate O-acetyltransferase complex protein AlgI
MLLVASYVFYSFWDWRFLGLIIISTLLDYFCGLKINSSNNPKVRKLFLILSVAGNLSILGFFKYYTFFALSLKNLFLKFGILLDPISLNIILPIGISFYTFQTMSYTIDIYRKELEPTKNFLDFALFVAFFPQLVAGPIERARNLLPQILNPRKLDLEKIYEGFYLIFWGLFLKIFIADNLANIVDLVFKSSAPYNGVEVLLATYAFAFQIFCDFAGYSNIARGVGKCLGFDIMINFNLPYFSKNPQEFWRRWHISLSTWLRDYLYIPLGGNREGTIKTYRNIFITMLLGGLWHGASWTFIIWGIYHGALLIIHRILKPLLKKIHNPRIFIIKKLWGCLKIIFFFQFISLGWIIFRAVSINQLTEMLYGLFFNFNLSTDIDLKANLFKFIFCIGILLIVQLFQYLKKDLMIVLKTRVPVRVFFYFIIFYSMILFGLSGENEFIYFQF